MDSLTFSASQMTTPVAKHRRYNPRKLRRRDRYLSGGRQRESACWKALVGKVAQEQSG